MRKETAFSLLLLIGVIFIVGREIAKKDFSPSYQYEEYEKAYKSSQYTGGSGLIPDETVFLYAAGAYIKGVNPLKVNPEMPPLGKYLLGLSIVLFNNANFIIVASGILSLITLYLLAKIFFKKTYLAFIPVAFFASEKLFLNQLKISPLLDIIQLPFILLSFYFFYRAVTTGKKAYFLTTGLALGFVISIKVMITGVLISIAWNTFLLLKREIESILKLFLITFPTAFLVLLISYMRIFIDGYSLWYFFLVQKWVLLYQQSKILFPLSAWRLIFFNQWQAWWGDFSLLKTEDWRITWPIITLLSFTYVLYKVIRREKMPNIEAIIASWIIVYSAFISLGTISTRHLLPLLPFLYLLSMRFLLMVKSKLLCELQ